MKLDLKNPPRRFTVGHAVKGTLHDCGSLTLDADEQVTFLTEAGAEYDVTRKGWGYYATPSLNGRLSGFGLRAVLARSRITGRAFLLLVETGKEAEFEAYAAQEEMTILAWLDSDAALDRVQAALEIAP